MVKIPSKNLKYQKIRKRLLYYKKIEIKHTFLKVGTIGLKSLKSSQLSSIVIDSFVKILNKKLKKIGQIIFFIKPRLPVTQKSIGVRMGKGSGGVKY